ncbi:hypothetical protein N7488_003495 [Penicillium malachiteum]|nr:hypothetical protein N7488_003495 [Penicillium malachiteum]
MASNSDSPSYYPVPCSAQRVFQQGILENANINKYLPPDVSEFASQIAFSGDSEPSIPVNWRFAESAAALKALEATLIAALMKRKFDLPFQGATTDTDHAQLFIMSCFLWEINPGSEHPISLTKNQKSLDKLIPNYNFGGRDSSMYRKMVTSTYKTSDSRYFNLHGGLNPNVTLDMLGLPRDLPVSNREEAVAPFIERISRISSEELQYLAADHAKANSHVSLFEIHDYPSPKQGPTWWSYGTTQDPSSRPLAGIKVVDMSRIIAAPAVSRGLAELGASVMRVTSPHLPDMHVLLIDLNWGRWNCSVDLKTDAGQQALRDLILEADVVVQGYRPNSLEKYGFSPHDILSMTKDRAKGIIVLRENCYGWYGPWSDRAGWQQISDSCVGVSHGFGKAMGHTDGESVTAIFPNSDYMCGVSGVCATLLALMRRGENGGSYFVDVALNYYNQWLVDCVGEYPESVWQSLWARHGKQVFRSFDNPSVTTGKVLASMLKRRGNILFNPSFFETRQSKALEVNIRMVKPVINFHGNVINLGYNVGTRGNGHDKARWPEDQITEEVR